MAGTDAKAARIYTIPNLISLLRLLCVPLALWLLYGSDHPAIAAWLLAGLGATDWIDGWIARRFDQGSELGKILDPTADRLLLITSAIILIAEDLPGIVKVFVWLVLVREVVIGAVTVGLALAGARRIDVLWVGKAGTLAIMFSLPMFLLAAHVDGWGYAVLTIFGWGFGVSGAVLGYVAAARYIPQAKVALAEGRAARAAAQ